MGHPTHEDDRHADEHPPNATLIEPYMPPPESDKPYTTKQIRDPLDYATFGITVITLVVLGIYTTINYCLYQATVSTNQANQRALIFVTSMELQKKGEPLPEDFPKNVTNGSVIVHFENFGETPGMKVLQKTSVCMRKYDIPDEFTYRDLGQLQHVPALIPPRTTFTTEIPVRPDHIDDAIKYKTSLYVWGTINYIDIFKQPHLTEFCAKYEGAEKTADSDSITYNFEQCPTHNCTDADCPKKQGYDDSIDCENVESSPSK